MSICDLNSGLSRLQRATKELREAWLETRKDWDDQNAVDFEKKHLEPILPYLRLLGSELSELLETYNNAERDCRDEMAQSEA